MSLSAADYQKLYQLQDKVFTLLAPHLDGYYLTGGTALGRFYLDHRYSDDLDFFTNHNPDFEASTRKLVDILSGPYPIDERVTLVSDTYVRILLQSEVPLKIEFVHDTAYRWGAPIVSKTGIAIDTVGNILANKLTALVSRDEPKDVFDILHIALTYQFNWQEVYHHAFKKQIMSEQDVAMRLASFPAHLLTTQPWLKTPVAATDLAELLDRLADDFLFARENSLGSGEGLSQKAQ